MLEKTIVVVMRPMTVVVTMRMVHQPIVRGKVGVAWLCGDTTNIVIRIYPFHFHQMHICKHFTRSSYLSSATRAFLLQPTQRIARRGLSRRLRGSSLRRSRRRSRLRFRKGIYFWSGMLLSPLYGLLIFQNRKINIGGPVHFD